MKNGDFSGKLKHIETRFFFLADELKKGRFEIKHVPGKENPADLFTKPVSKQVWDALAHQLVQE